MNDGIKLELCSLSYMNSEGWKGCLLSKGGHQASLQDSACSPGGPPTHRYGVGGGVVCWHGTSVRVALFPQDIYGVGGYSQVVSEVESTWTITCL